jgi:hypothetical protein
MKIPALICFVLLFIAASNPSLPKLKAVCFGHHYHDTLVYRYDNKGRVSGYTFTNGHHTSYEYQANTLIERTIGGGVVTMYLNRSGLVDSLIDHDPSRTMTIDSSSTPYNKMINLGGKMNFPYAGQHILSLIEANGMSHDIVTFQKKFIYDLNGYLIQERSYADGRLYAISDNVIENRNIKNYSVRYVAKDTVTERDLATGKTGIYVMGLDEFNVYNTYDTQHPNTLAVENYTGKCNKNLLKRSINISLAKDTTISTYSYTFDKQGRVNALYKAVKSNTPAEYNQDAYEADTLHFTYY